jgi:hypothetical protein
MNCTVCSTGRARFTYENTAIELRFCGAFPRHTKTSLSTPNKAGAEQQIALRSLIGDVKHTIAELPAAEGVYFRSASFLDAPGNSGSCSPLERNRRIMANGATAGSWQVFSIVTNVLKISLLEYKAFPDGTAVL